MIRALLFIVLVVFTVSAPRWAKKDVVNDEFGQVLYVYVLPPILSDGTTLCKQMVRKEQPVVSCRVADGFMSDTPALTQSFRDG